MTNGGQIQARRPQLPARNNKLFEILACGDGQKSGTTWSHVQELSASYKIVLLGLFVLMSNVRGKKEDEFNAPPTLFPGCIQRCYDV